MSDTENTQIEETPLTPEESTQEAAQTTESIPTAESNTHRGNNHRNRDGGRPPRGDKRGPRRDGVKEEDKEFQEEMLAVDRVTRVTA